MIEIYGICEWEHTYNHTIYESLVKLKKTTEGHYYWSYMGIIDYTVRITENLNIYKINRVMSHTNNNFLEGDLDGEDVQG